VLSFVSVFNPHDVYLCSGTISLPALQWPAHKQMCKLMRKMRNASCEAEVIEEIAKAEAKSEKGMISSLMMTHVGWVSTDTNEDLPPELPENFLYIHEAMNKYASLGKKKREFGEAIYRRLYEELVENDEEWEDVSGMIELLWCVRRSCALY